METLFTMRGQLLRYMRDDEDPALCNDALNDAVDSLWLSVLLVSLGQFLGGPVSNSLQLAPGDERATIVTIPDPPALVNGNFSQQAQLAGPTPLPIRKEIFTATYVTESGSETNYGIPLTVDVGLGQLSVIAPPTFPNIPTGNPVGWNLYGSGNPIGVAPDPNGLFRQNELPIRFDQTFIEADAGLTPQGDLPPTANGTADNIFYIRVIEVQQQDQTWKRWVAGDLDGLLMDRAVKQIASTSIAQCYAYDVVRGSTVEIRPAAGTALNPRFFWVAKPRRLRFDNSPFPFQNLAYSEFIKSYAAAQLKRSSHEYTAANLESSNAERVRIQILEGLNTQATTKQKNITPFMRY